MTVAEGGGRRAVTRKFKEVYVPALKANFMIWPMVQILNFRIIPLQFQIVSCQFRQGLIQTNSLNFTAFRFYGWNSMDGLSISYKFC